MVQVKSIGFVGKDNWKYYLCVMLCVWCISEGVCIVFFGIVQGVYMVEEVQDMVLLIVMWDMGVVDVVEVLWDFFDVVIVVVGKGWVLFVVWWKDVKLEYCSVFWGYILDFELIVKQVEVVKDVIDVEVLE